MHTHDDGTLKVAGVLFKDLAVLLAGIQPLAYDAQTRLVTTSAGTLSARLASETGGGHEILHAAGGRLFAGMAKGEVRLGNSALVGGPAEAYLFVRAQGADFATAPELLVKSERPGELTVGRAGATAVELVDPAPSSCRMLEQVDFTERDGTTRLNVTGEMTSYWLRLRFGGSGSGR
jgi:hypothetical protein